MFDHRLRTFFSVAKHKSFSRAADELCLTQPAVSFQIKQLESQLDSILFIRAHHDIRLTQAGELLLKHVLKIFETYAAIERDLKKIKTEEEELRVYA